MTNDEIRMTNRHRTIGRPSRRRLFSSFVILISSLVGGQLAAAGLSSSAGKASVSFTADVAPILQRRCVACHGPEKSKGRYRLDTFAGLLKPGGDQATVIAGRPEKSRLFQLLVEKNPDDRMPQDAEPLPAAEIAVIRAWIAGGAKFDGASTTAALTLLMPRPVHPPAPQRYAQPWPVTALAFNAAGSELIAGGCHEITFWSVTNHALLRRVGGMPERIQALALPPGGNWLAVAGGAPGRSGELLLLNLLSNTAPRTLAVTGDAMLCAAFSPDGSRLAAGGTDKLLRVFAVKSGSEILRLEQHSDWVHSVAFSPDGQRLASASRDRTARVYNSTNGAAITTFRGHEAAVEFVTFNDDGKVLLTAGTDRKVRFSSVTETSKPGEFARFEVAVTGLARGEQSVFIALADGRVTQRRIVKRDEVQAFTGHGDRVTAMALHAASQRLATGAHDGKVRLWNLADGKLLGEFTASPGFVEVAGK